MFPGLQCIRAKGVDVLWLSPGIAAGLDSPFRGGAGVDDAVYTEGKTDFFRRGDLQGEVIQGFNAHRIRLAFAGIEIGCANDIGREHISSRTAGGRIQGAHKAVDVIVCRYVADVAAVVFHFFNSSARLVILHPWHLIHEVEGINKPVSRDIPAFRHVRHGLLVIDAHDDQTGE